MSTPKKHLHEKIRDDLLDKIHSGDYQIDEIIPKEIDLAEMYGVSRPTVRRAIQTLVTDGYLERRQRLGTIVLRNKIKQEFTHIIESYDSEMERKGLNSKTNVLSFKEELANYDVAKNLEIDELDPVYKLVRLRYAQKDPIVIVTTYIPKILVPDLIDCDFRVNKLYTQLSEAGYPVKSITRKLEVVKAGETTSDLLEIQENDPIFYFHSIGYTDLKTPIEYSISKYRGDLNTFIFEVNS